MPTSKKKPGRPPVDKSQDAAIYIKIKKNELAEAKTAAKSEGYTFSGWVKMLIRKEVKRIKRRKNRN